MFVTRRKTAPETVQDSCMSWYGFAGWLLKMNFIDASITAGLCMANSGGGGDIMVLGAAERLNLIPFAQISSRIGGSIILIVASLLARLFIDRCFVLSPMAAR